MSKDKVVNLYVGACMLVLAVVAFMCFTQPIATDRPDVQADLYSNVPKAIAGPPPTAAQAEFGDALAYMTIPRFGEDWLWTVSEGTTLDVLDKGPGHFPNTELPGQEGNSAYAAHRATHGDPFLDFDLLRPGDSVTIAQSGAEWVYEITTTPEIIDPSEKWILDDFDKGQWLTLTTCWPKYGSEKRMFVRAELTEVKS